MSLTYKDSGVDVEAGQKQVRLIKDLVKKTHRPGVLSDIGGFAGLFQPDLGQMEEPVLVSGTDGVGTKLKIAFLTDNHKTIGEDCVAMCVNDIICQGARPLFFLDYVATGKLVPEKMAEVVEGVANGCIKGQCSLIGGETAEMPGFYREDEYDMAGFAVGIVDKKKIIDGSKIEEGDQLIGLASSGIHSNGYSLVRKIVFDRMNFQVDTYIDELDMTIGQALIEPTRIYTDPVCDLVDEFNIKGICHITGGGFYENIPRMLGEGLRAEIDLSDYRTPEIFNCLQKWGNIEEDEMYRTFNMGIGMVLAVSADEKEAVEKYLEEKGEEYFPIGRVVKGEKGIEICQ